MAVHMCGTCGQVRARAGEDICPVCWLVRELAREHRDGEHQEPNASCIACTRAQKPARPNRSKRRTKSVVTSEPVGIRIDHSQCNHPMTPRERAKCRTKKRGS